MERILVLPLRVNELLSKHHHRLLKIVLLLLVFVTALYTKQFKGDYQQFINNHVGGVLYVLFGSLAFSAIAPHTAVYRHAILAFLLTSLLEFIQWLHIPFMVELTRIKAFAYLFGNSFNPADFIYYAVGALVGVGVLYLIGYSEREEERL